MRRLKPDACTSFQKILIFSAALFLAHTGTGQSLDPMLLQKRWPAKWITVPGTEATVYGVYLFRKTLNLQAVPKTCVVHVSGDNRYKLYVNEKLVSLGPARGDATHWNFETVDLAPLLHAGANTISAQVWNDGEDRPEAQISLMTGFILQADAGENVALNTDSSWKCIRDNSYRAIPVHMDTYYVAGPGEFIDMNAHIKNWQGNAFNESEWASAKVLFPATPATMQGAYGIANGWMLVPSRLPQMEMKYERFATVRTSTGVGLPKDFPSAKKTVMIPANTSATILLDQQHLTNAYPTLIFSAGKGAGISLTYAEALFTKYPDKGNRNEVEGKVMIGRKDSIVSDGSANQQFTPLVWRTYRYVQLNVTTKQEPLELNDVYGTFTGYPFTFNAKFETGQADLQQIMDIGWRTARLCAVETYMDCPYYEQLQYIGDSRIQALISFYNSGDERLLRNAITMMDHSRQPEGVTLSRHPSASPQYIPTFSLWYIGMLHDYMSYGSDSAFLKDKLSGQRQILNYFAKYQQRDGSLKNVPWWTFTDWVTREGWSDGMAPVGKDGNSAALDLQLLWAYQLAADMEDRGGMKTYAMLFRQQAGRLKQTIQKKYWNAARRLFADRPEQDLYSQHVNSLAILTGMISKERAGEIGNRLLSDTSLAQASIYFKYYLHRALIAAGLGGNYLQWLGTWRNNISMGLTTWAEVSEISDTRSDCHAWGSSPNIEFLRTILGVDSDAPYFARVKVEPHPGDLRNFSGEVPHPKGKIVVSYKNLDAGGTAEIVLPAKISGRFVWKGKNYPLKPGANMIKL